MTDEEYIEAFLEEDQRAFSQFYVQKEKDFKGAISKHFRILNPEFLADVYQDAIIRMWENIKKRKLTAQNLTTTLSGYLYRIGENVALEALRKEKETTVDMSDETDDDGIPFRAIDQEAARSIEEYEEDARMKMIRETVYGMGKPCAPLLLNFYWDKKSWTVIALELGYKDANSAKTQKNKCMNKLKALFRR